MKRRKDKGKAVSVFFVVLIMLVHLLFLLPTVYADDQIIASFDPFINEPPDRPINIAPVNGSTGVEIPVTLQALVYDNTSLGQILVSFHNAADDSLIGSTSVDNGSIASVIWSDRQSGNNYRWYVIANDSRLENTSSTWTFTTKAYAGGGGHTPPQNNPPIANTSGPTIGYANETLHFFANGSYDVDGSIVGYRWDFENDGLFDTDWLNDVYSEPGTYTVKLQVKDNDGATSIDSYIIDIVLLGPDQNSPFALIEIDLEEELVINETISFNATGSYDPDGFIVDYLWDFGDGNTSTLLHSYKQPGNYTVTLTVTDDDNLTSVAVVTVSILDDKPDERTQPLYLLMMLVIATITVILSLLLYFKGDEFNSLSNKPDKYTKNTDRKIKPPFNKISRTSRKKTIKNIGAKVDKLLLKLDKTEKKK